MPRRVLIMRGYTMEELATLLGILIALVTLIGVFVKFIKSITELTMTLKLVKDDLGEMTDKNSKAHARIWEELDDHEARIRCQELLCKERTAAQ